MEPVVIQVTTNPGTPVQVSTAKMMATLLWAANFDAAQIVSFGNIHLNRSTGAGIIGLLPPKSSGAIPDTNIYKFPPTTAEYPYDLRDYWVDSATAAVVNVTAWTL